MLKPLDKRQYANTKAMHPKNFDLLKYIVIWAGIDLEIMWTGIDFDNVTIQKICEVAFNLSVPFFVQHQYHDGH